MHLTSCIIFYFGIFSVTIVMSSGCRIVSFNAGLTPKVRYYDDRKVEITPALEDLNADVVCLQEVWFSKDVARIVEDLKTTLPYSYSAVHNKVDHVAQVLPTESPCMTTKFVFQFLPCLSMRCGSSDKEQSYLRCAEQECGLLDLDQHCITCLVMTDTASPVQRCLLETGNRLNSGGLLLLSKYPLEEVTMKRFEPEKKLVLPRGYLAAKVDSVGTVVCTHTTANLGPYYFEKLAFTSWQDQSEAEARELLRLVLSDDRAIVMGDLNSSPSVPKSNVDEDMPATLRLFSQAGFTSAYVDVLGICTWCKYNPLAHAQRAHILDHIFTKGLNVSTAQRVLDDIRVRGRYPLSDHYGVQVTLNLLKNSSL